MARAMIVRAGVAACVVLAALVSASKLDDTLGVLDLRADTNASLTYFERTYPAEDWVAGSGRVLEDARLWMPPDATYRVLVGRGADYLSDFGRYFALGLLLPRRQTASRDAEWLLCYGCGGSGLGERYRVLSRSGNELWFGRRKR